MIQVLTQLVALPVPIGQRDVVSVGVLVVQEALDLTHARIFIMVSFMNTFIHIDLISVHKDEFGVEVTDWVISWLLFLKTSSLFA